MKANIPEIISQLEELSDELHGDEQLEVIMCIFKLQRML